MKSRIVHPSVPDIVSLPQFPFGYIRLRGDVLPEQLRIEGESNTPEGVMTYSWEVTGNRAVGGLPTGIENEIEIIAYYLFQKQGPTFSFTKSDTWNILNYPNHKSNRDAVKRGIMKFAQLTIRTANALINPKTGLPYNDKQSLSQFFFLQSLHAEVYGSRANFIREKDPYRLIMDEDYVEITGRLSEPMITLLSNSKGFEFDLDLYRRLPRYISRRIFRFLNDLDLRGMDAIPVEEMSTKLPLIRTTRWYAEKNLTKPLEDLKKVSILNGYRITDDGLLQVRFRSRAARPTVHRNVSLHQRMIELGVFPSKATEACEYDGLSDEQKWDIVRRFQKAKDSNPSINAGQLVKWIFAENAGDSWLDKKLRRNPGKQKEMDFGGNADGADDSDRVFSQILSLRVNDVKKILDWIDSSGAGAFIKSQYERYREKNLDEIMNAPVLRGALIDGFKELFPELCKRVDED